MKKFFSLVLALVMALSLTTVAWGATKTVYVDAAGSDANDGLTAATAVATLSQAVTLVGDGDTISIAAGTYAGIGAPAAADYSRLISISIIGAGVDATIIEDGFYWGYDHSQTVNKTVTVKGITFKGAGLTVADIANVVIDGNKFVNISGHAAIAVLDQEYSGMTGSAVITNNVIDGVAGTGVGIEVRNGYDVTITGNTIKNTGHNSLQLTKNSALAQNAGVVSVTGNTLENWGVSGEGRAMRVNLGADAAGTTEKDVAIESNAMTHANAPEEFVKMTAVDTNDTASLSNNYWNGVAPTAAMVDADNTAVATYYTTATGGVLSGLTSNVPATDNLTRYTLWGAKVAATATGVNYIATDMQLPTATKAVAPTATNLTGAVVYYTVGGSKYIKGTANDCDIYFTVKGKTTPVMYLKEIGTQNYWAVATEFTNFGKKCGQSDTVVAENIKYYTYTALDGTVYVHAEDTSVGAMANAVDFLLVGGKMVPVVPTNVYNEVAHTWTFAYDEAGKVVSAKCEDCGVTAKVYTTYTAVPAGAKYIREGAYFLVVNAPVVTDKVESAATFDAGIAMYVGMSVMAAAGSVVVLKKRED